MDKLAIVEEIHEGFSSKLEKASQGLLNQALVIPEMPEEATYAQLVRLGFSDIKDSHLIKERHEKRKVLDKVSELKRFITRVRNKFPHKLIALHQVYQILEQYDLYVSTANNYIGHIPLKNANEIIEYKKLINPKHYERDVDFMSPFDHNGDARPLFALDGSRYDREPTYLMCAPLSNFKLENRSVVERDIIYSDKLKPRLKMIKYENPDPIVLTVLKTPIVDFYLCHIVTAFGPEASDPVIVNERMN